MAMKRRQFIQGLAITGMGIPLFSMMVNAKPQSRFISAQGAKEGEFGIALGQSEQPINTLSTSFRGHSVLQHEKKPDTVLMFARRPGYQVVEVNYENISIKTAFDVTQGYNLQGHGSFTTDGQYLFTTENDNETGQGFVSVRDGNNYQLLDQFSTQGIGPHELKVLPDGKTLVVANGGILTRPETGRQKHNLTDMDSNLSYIDLNSGKVIDQFKVDEDKSSIRHLDITNDGSVVFAMQNQRDAMSHSRTVSLAGVHHPNAAIELLKEPEAIFHKMNDYMGSIAISHKSRIAGFTSPKGNLAAFWHIDSGELINYHRFHDVCGIAVDKQSDEFLLSNSTGQVRFLEHKTLVEARSKRQHFEGVKWDNHLLSVT